MANRTVKDAKNIHGTNPQYLIEKIIRSRIYDSKFWKEQCFALTAELLVDKGKIIIISQVFFSDPDESNFSAIFFTFQLWKFDILVACSVQTFDQHHFCA